MFLSWYKKIIGRLEQVSIPEFGISSVVAKIDTGAYNNAIHTSHIEEFERDGKQFIRFVVLDETHPEFKDKVHETDTFTTQTFRNSTGGTDVRYVLPVTIILKGIRLRAKVSLVDRTDMRYPLLLGRKVLKKNFIIDPSKKFTQ